MSWFLLLCLCSVLLAASQAAGRTEYVLGGADGIPWQEARTASMESSSFFPRTAR